MEHYLYDDLVNTLPSGVYRLRVFQDVSLIEEKWFGNKDIPYIVEYASERFSEILHLDRDAFIKDPRIIHNLIYEPDKAEFARLNVEANLKKIPFIWEGRFLIDDKIAWIQFKSIPRILENKDIIWTGTIDDINFRKKIEEDIKLKNAELLRLNADKDILLSILAHDLINPFNTILGYLDLLSNNLNLFDIEEIEKHLSAVNYSAKSAFHLLEDILLWARSESGAIPFEPRELNLKHCFDEAVQILEPNANKKNITINFVEAKNINVYADIYMLNTVFRNLISNAIKFTNRGGEINVYAEQSNSVVTIAVSDNGVGITPEVMSKLFDTTQLHSSRGTANEKGTGFGLLLCKRFIEKHGGIIGVESESGLGSVFKFTLPHKTEF